MSDLLTPIFAYYAGFVDGEGYIGIKKYVRKQGQCPMYSEKVSVGVVIGEEQRKIKKKESIR